MAPSLAASMASFSLASRMSAFDDCTLDHYRDGQQPGRLRRTQSLPTLQSEESMWCTVEFGRIGSLHYRMLFLNRQGNEVSPWHDLPLHNGSGELNFLCLTPQGRWAEFEPAEEEPFTPLKLTKRRNLPAHFVENCQSWNFGFLPQTWANPEECEPEFGKLPFRGGPLEVVALGLRRSVTGEIYPVKPVGAFALVDPKGRLSWKLLAVAANEDKFGDLDTLQDLRDAIPGGLEEVRNWLRTIHCDVECGESENRFANGGEPVGRDHALRIVAEQHASWQLRAEQEDLRADWSMPNAGLTSRLEYEMMWATHTEGESDVCIPLSETSSTSLVHLERAWADVSTTDVWEGAHKPRAKSPPAGKKQEAEGRPSGQRSSKKVAIKKFLQSMSKLVRPHHNHTPKFKMAVNGRGEEGSPASNRRSPTVGLERRALIEQDWASSSFSEPDFLNSLGLGSFSSDGSQAFTEDPYRSPNSLSMRSSQHARWRQLEPSEFIAQSGPLQPTTYDEEEEGASRIRRRVFHVVSNTVRRSPSGNDAGGRGQERPGESRETQQIRRALEAILPEPSRRPSTTMSGPLPPTYQWADRMGESRRGRGRGRGRGLAARRPPPLELALSPPSGSSSGGEDSPAPAQEASPSGGSPNPEGSMLPPLRRTKSLAAGDVPASSQIPWLPVKEAISGPLQTQIGSLHQDKSSSEEPVQAQTYLSYRDKSPPAAERPAQAQLGNACSGPLLPRTDRLGESMQPGSSLRRTQSSVEVPDATSPDSERVWADLGPSASGTTGSPSPSPKPPRTPLVSEPSFAMLPISTPLELPDDEHSEPWSIVSFSGPLQPKDEWLEDPLVNNQRGKHRRSRSMTMKEQCLAFSTTRVTFSKGLAERLREQQEASQQKPRRDLEADSRTNPREGSWEFTLNSAGQPGWNPKSSQFQFTA